MDIFCALSPPPGIVYFNTLLPADRERHWHISLIESEVRDKPNKTHNGLFSIILRYFKRNDESLVFAEKNMVVAKRGAMACYHALRSLVHEPCLKTNLFHLPKYVYKRRKRGEPTFFSCIEGNKAMVAIDDRSGDVIPGKLNRYWERKEEISPHIPVPLRR